MLKNFKTLKQLVATIFATSIMVACTVESQVQPDSSKKWDSLSFRIFIRDTNNYDLLDTTSKNYLGTQITLNYQGKKYKINYPKADSTKKLKYQELKLEKFEDSARYCIYFGPLEGNKYYDDDFTLSWKLKKAVANQPATEHAVIHLKHIIFKDTAQTQWLFNNLSTGIDSVSASFNILRTLK